MIKLLKIKIKFFLKIEKKYLEAKKFRKWKIIYKNMVKIFSIWIYKSKLCIYFVKDGRVRLVLYI